MLLLNEAQKIFPATESTEEAKGLPELAEENFNIAEGPEYDDPVEAVTVFRCFVVFLLCLNAKIYLLVGQTPFTQHLING